MVTCIPCWGVVLHIGVGRNLLPRQHHQDIGNILRCCLGNRLYQGLMSYHSRERKCYYCSVLQIHPPCIQAPPSAFLVQSLAEVFLSHAEEHSFHSQDKVSTTNTDRPHQRWTHQLLHAPQCRSSSAYLALGVSLHLTLSPCFTQLRGTGREGVIVREIIASRV